MVQHVEYIKTVSGMPSSRASSGPAGGVRVCRSPCAPAALLAIPALNAEPTLMKDLQCRPAGVANSGVSCCSSCRLQIRSCTLSCNCCCCAQGLITSMFLPSARAAVSGCLSYCCKLFCCHMHARSYFRTMVAVQLQQTMLLQTLGSFELIREAMSLGCNDSYSLSMAWPTVVLHLPTKCC